MPVLTLEGKGLKQCQPQKCWWDGESISPKGKQMAEYTLSVHINSILVQSWLLILGSQLSSFSLESPDVGVQLAVLEPVSL